MQQFQLCGGTVREAKDTCTKTPLSNNQVLAYRLFISELIDDFESGRMHPEDLGMDTLYRLKQLLNRSEECLKTKK